MLNNTFHHIPGIGMKTEQELWAAGVNHWDRLTDPDGLKISPKRLSTLTRYVDESRRQMDEKNYTYFEELLPSALHWRFFPEFRRATAYLDIETTGLEWDYESITTIALYDGENIRHYVKDRNLDDFPKDIQQYKVIVTYNGKCFDVPFIEHQFGIHLAQVHLDLRYILKSLGFKGGLKGCEKSLGIDRGELDGVDGYFAILLWNDYMKNRNAKALETLLAYNIEDVVNLEILMVKAYNMKIQETPFGLSNELPLPPAPELPFHPDLPTVDRLRRRFY